MKTLILSTGLAALLGATAIAPASAAPIATHGVIAAPAAVTNVGCSYEKRTTVRNGVKRVTRTRVCDDDDDDVVVRRRTVVRERGYESRDYDRPRRPGLSINVR